MPRKTGFHEIRLTTNRPGLLLSSSTRNAHREPRAVVVIIRITSQRVRQAYSPSCYARSGFLLIFYDVIIRIRKFSPVFFFSSQSIFVRNRLTATLLPAGRLIDAARASVWPTRQFHGYWSCRAARPRTVKFSRASVNNNNNNSVCPTRPVEKLRKIVLRDTGAPPLLTSVCENNKKNTTTVDTGGRTIVGARDDGENNNNNVRKKKRPPRIYCIEFSHPPRSGRKAFFSGKKRHAPCADTRYPTIRLEGPGMAGRRASAALIASFGHNKISRFFGQKKLLVYT